MQIDRRNQSILSREAQENMHMSALRKNLKTNFSDLSSRSTCEQIPLYKIRWPLEKVWNILFKCWQQNILIVYYFKHVLFRYDFIKRICLICERQFNGAWAAVYTVFVSMDTRKVDSSLIKICAVPFLYFNSYSIYPEDVESFEIKQERRETMAAKLLNYFKQIFRLTCKEEKPTFKSKSLFLRTALDQHENDLFHQGNNVLEVLLQYKWKTFARKRFMQMYCIYIIYYISYSIGVLFPKNVFDYTNEASVLTDSRHILCIVSMLTTGFFLFSQEVRQFNKSTSKLSYIVSPYNIVDFIALILPLVGFWQLLYNIEGQVSLYTVEC